MKGAEALIRTLVGGGVDICFANPGTSEMHFVAALDAVPEMRPVLALFEGVATGAADGYARMTERPASTLLHLGPGMANALANVHNARKSFVPMLNLVGDHATDHRQYNAPLTSDIEGLARPLSDWLKTSKSATDLAQDGAEALAAAGSQPGQIATLVLPADVSWSEAGELPSTPAASSSIAPSRNIVEEPAVESAARALKSGQPAIILLNGHAMRAPALEAASRVANHTGARLLCDTLTTRWERGAGRAQIERFPYLADAAVDLMRDVRHLILVGAQSPVASFAYPDKPNDFAPAGCQVHVLAEPGDDAIDALERLADAVRAPASAATLHEAERPDSPHGTLDPRSIALAIAAHLPENAIIADEGITAGGLVGPLTAGAPPHDWLMNCGGAIGLGLPLATGAAIACPDRPVICLEGDGSAMYTFQALWTQAREGANVTTIVFANRAYRILDLELAKMGAAGGGRGAADLLDISRPDLDFVSLAQGMGVPAKRVDRAEDFATAFARSLAEPGPHLIEAVIDA